MNAHPIKSILVTLSASIKEKVVQSQFYLESCLANHQYDEVTQILLNWQVENLIYLCQISSSVFKFCFRNKFFNTKLIDILRSKSYPALNLYTLDGQLKYTYFDLYIGALYLSVFLMPKIPEDKSQSSLTFRKQALNYAYEFGLQEGFITLCYTENAKIENSKSNDEACEKAINNIINYCDKLSELYWGVGFVQAGTILLKMGLSLKNANSARSQSIIELAVKHFLSALYIADLPRTKEICKEILNDKDMVSLIRIDNLSVNSWDMIKIMLQDLVNDRYAILERKAKTITLPYFSFKPIR